MSENQTGFDGSRPSALDDAIDRAVRQMVQVDPPSGLRRRVLSRLAGRPAPSRMRMGYMAAAATLCMLVLAVGLLLRGRAPVSTGVGPAPAQEAGKQLADISKPAERPTERGRVPDPEARPSRRATSAPARARRAPHADLIPMPEIANVFGAPANTITGASVSAPESDARGALGESVAASPIEIRALTIPPLEIAPLGIPEIPAAKTRR
jgi:hypothetical protein